ncbi:MAG: Mur ligase family protein [Patescibacteria group bacterium]|nr:Mur ligase family protein [Patescibacteria group bacterium]
MKLKNFEEAETFLNSLIKNGSKQLFQSEKGILRMRYFLSLLGYPQEKIKIIHIAGTSGKGSTCYLISKLLFVHRLKVGLSLSPHIVDIRERFQINNKKISKKKFVFYLNQIVPFIEKLKNSSYGSLSYFETLVGLAFYIFYQEKVDYAVIETGLGGWYDATNVVDREDKISVITKIGFDHMQVLGSTLDKIALQKAMIINKNSQALSIDQEKIAKKVIKETAFKKNAKIKFIKPLFLKEKISLLGDYQKENAGLAFEVLKLVAEKEKFKIKNEAVKKVFKNAFLIGRFDIKKIKNKILVLDGAHNQPKMKAFIYSLKKKYPNKKFFFLLAFKKRKDYKKMLEYIFPVAYWIVFTSFFEKNQNFTRLSEDSKKIIEFLKLKNFKKYTIIDMPKEAFDYSFKKTRDILVITGSFYLLGEIYKFIKD